MKKLLFLILVLISTNINSQSLFSIPFNPLKTKVKIEGDKIDSEGVRTVISSKRAVNKLDNKEIGGVLFSVIGSCLDGQQGIILSMYIDTTNGKLSVNENSPVLIKTKNDSIIHCTFSKGDNDELGKVGSIIGSVYTRYCITPTINLNTDIVNDIFKKGISKIRFELNGAPCDIILKKDNISSFIYDSYKLVESTLSSKKTFYDDF